MTFLPTIPPVRFWIAQEETLGQRTLHIAMLLPTREYAASLESVQRISTGATVAYSLEDRAGKVAPILASVLSDMGFHRGDYDIVNGPDIIWNDPHMQRVDDRVLYTFRTTIDVSLTKRQS